MLYIHVTAWLNFAAFCLQVYCLPNDFRKEIKTTSCEEVDVETEIYTETHLKTIHRSHTAFDQLEASGHALSTSKVTINDIPYLMIEQSIDSTPVPCAACAGMAVTTATVTTTREVTALKLSPSSQNANPVQPTTTRSTAAQNVPALTTSAGQESTGKGLCESFPNTYMDHNDRIYDVKCNYDFHGPDIGSAQCLTFAECFTKCDALAKCIAFTYLPVAGVGTCFFKDDISRGEKAQKGAHAAVLVPQSAFKPKPTDSPSLLSTGPTTPIASPASCRSLGSEYHDESGLATYEVSCGVDHYGGDLSNIPASSFEGCIDICDATDECIGFAYERGAEADICYLKKFLTAPKIESNIDFALKSKSSDFSTLSATFTSSPTSWYDDSRTNLTSTSNSALIVASTSVQSNILGSTQLIEVALGATADSKSSSLFTISHIAAIASSGLSKSKASASTSSSSRSAVSPSFSPLVPSPLPITIGLLKGDLLTLTGSSIRPSTLIHSTTLSTKASSGVAPTITLPSYVHNKLSTGDPISHANSPPPQPTGSVSLDAVRPAVTQSAAMSVSKVSVARSPSGTATFYKSPFTTISPTFLSADDPKDAAGKASFPSDNKASLPIKASAIASSRNTITSNGLSESSTTAGALNGSSVSLSTTNTSSGFDYTVTYYNLNTVYVSEFDYTKTLTLKSTATIISVASTSSMLNTTEDVPTIVPRATGKDTAQSSNFQVLNTN